VKVVRQKVDPQLAAEGAITLLQLSEDFWKPQLYQTIQRIVLLTVSMVSSL
jgi:hypothetical protein